MKLGKYENKNTVLAAWLNNTIEAEHLLQKKN